MPFYVLRSKKTLSKTAETDKTDGMQNICRLYLTDGNKNCIIERGIEKGLPRTLEK